MIAIATKKTPEQRSNRRTDRLIRFNGMTRTLTDWAREIGISQPLLWWRLDHGWPVELALTKSAREYRTRDGCGASA